MKVFIRHIRMAKLCSNGTRAWWARRGLDWSDFLSNGIDAETLLGTGDPAAKRVVEIARNEHVS